MGDSDGPLAALVDPPLATPPSMEALVERARRHRHRRWIGRGAAAALLAVAMLAGALALTPDRDRTVRTAAPDGANKPASTGDLAPAGAPPAAAGVVSSAFDVNDVAARASTGDGGSSADSGVVTTSLPPDRPADDPPDAPGSVAPSEPRGSEPPGTQPSDPSSPPLYGSPKRVTVTPGTTAAQPQQFHTAMASGSQSLAVRFWAGPEECTSVARVDVVETNEQVTVTLWMGRPPGVPAETACITIALYYEVVVDLAAPLGDRTVVDGAR